MEKKWMDKFEAIEKNPQAVAEDWKKKTGGKVIGWAIPDGPEELILAAGALPLALLGAGIPFSRADAHFQSFACSYSRSLLEQITRGELDFVAALIFPHTCDAMRALDLVVKDLGRIKYVESFRPPRLRDSEAAAKYLKEELGRIRGRLAEITGHSASDQEIRQASETINELKTELMNLKKEMAAGRASAMEYFSAVSAGMAGDKPEVTKLVKELISESKSRKAEKAGKKPVILAGKVAEPLELIAEIEKAGFLVVDELLVNGSRYVESLVDLKRDPIEGLIRAQFDKIPVAGFYHRKETRSERILKRVKESNAAGVIYLLQKFCEPYEMEVVGVEEDLKKAGVKVLRLESDYQVSSLAPLRTRIDAFGEMLAA